MSYWKLSINFINSGIFWNNFYGQMALIWFYYRHHFGYYEGELNEMMEIDWNERIEAG